MTDNAKEISKFDKLADQWWQPQGRLKTLHQINPLRLQFIQQHLHLPQQKIVDIGCGGGILTEALALKQADVMGIDLSPNAIKAAQKHAEQSELAIHYQVCDSQDIVSQQAGEFDAVVCMELLEHVDQPDNLIADCAQLLKPGGWLFASTLNRTPKAYFLGILTAEYLLNMLDRGTHDYAHFIKPAELAQCLRQQHMSLESLKGITYQPCEQTFRLTDDVSVNYLAAAQKLSPN